MRHFTVAIDSQRIALVLGISQFLFLHLSKEPVEPKLNHRLCPNLWIASKHVHIQQLEFANISLPTLVYRVKVA